MKRFLGFIAVLVIVCCSCVWAGTADRHGPVSFVLLHVNDTHSQFTAKHTTFRFPDMDSPVLIPLGSVSRMAALVGQVRDRHPHVLFLHSGDMVQGSIYYTLFHGRADVQVYNAMGLDAMAAGNHEFDRGTPGIEILLDHADFPILSANMDTKNDADLDKRIAPYVIKKMDGEPVAVIGLLEEHLANISSPSAGTRMLPVIETAQNTINRLTDQGVQIIILLTHIGYDNDLVLGTSVTGADIIVGGHSHTLLGDFQKTGLVSQGPYPTIVQAPDKADVLVVQAWERTRMLGQLMVAFCDAGRLTSFAGIPCLIAGTPFLDENKNPLDPQTLTRVTAAVDQTPGIFILEQDPAIAAITMAYTKKAALLGKTTVGKAVTDLAHIKVPDRYMPQGSQIAPIVADALKWQLNRSGLQVDIAIQNGGGVRTDLAAGDITVETVYELLPFENTMIVFEMTGKRIKTMLEDAVSGIMDDRLFYGGFPYASGLRYRINPAGTPGNRIVSCEIMNDAGKWQTAVSKKVYRVGVNRFLADGGDGYTAFADLIGYDTGYVDTQAFIAYVTEKKTIHPLPGQDYYEEK
ncbi:MAG: 5'-nucleotidase C-terminal domain-containing protein [Desulfotignum sp.]|nr:5'-nucleotidase C-terminal domain-containing protein [Desulfotignum sp.]MCF8126428.1 5'-nucleotidase C-terminal domain-containing protein [Desulfotignum sp.]